MAGVGMRGRDESFFRVATNVYDSVTNSHCHVRGVGHIPLAAAMPPPSPPLTGPISGWSVWSSLK